MAAGAELDEIYLDVLTPAMVAIGERWAAGELDISIEHRATGIAMRIVGRIGPRFSRRGRSRGVVALGAPAGEFHALPVAMLGDLLRLRGWDVSDFGVDVPSESIAHVITRDARSRWRSGCRRCRRTTSHRSPTRAQRLASRIPTVLVVVGGQAVVDLDHARSLGADAYAADRPRHGRACSPATPCPADAVPESGLSGSGPERPVVERTCVR